MSGRSSPFSDSDDDWGEGVEVVSLYSNKKKIDTPIVASAVDSGQVVANSSALNKPAPPKATVSEAGGDKMNPAVNAPSVSVPSVQSPPVEISVDRTSAVETAPVKLIGVESSLDELPVVDVPVDEGVPGKTTTGAPVFTASFDWASVDPDEESDSEYFPPREKVNVLAETKLSKNRQERASNEELTGEDLISIMQNDPKVQKLLLHTEDELYDAVIYERKDLLSFPVSSSQEIGCLRALGKAFGYRTVVGDSRVKYLIGPSKPSLPSVMLKDSVAQSVLHEEGLLVQTQGNAKLLFGDPSGPVHDQARISAEVGPQDAIQKEQETDSSDPEPKPELEPRQGVAVSTTSVDADPAAGPKSFILQLKELKENLDKLEARVAGQDSKIEMLEQFVKTEFRKMNDRANRAPRVASEPISTNDTWRSPRTRESEATRHGRPEGRGFIAEIRLIASVSSAFRFKDEICRELEIDREHVRTVDPLHALVTFENRGRYEAAKRNLENDSFFELRELVNASSESKRVLGMAHTPQKRTTRIDVGLADRIVRRSLGRR